MSSSKRPFSTSTGDGATTPTLPLTMLACSLLLFLVLAVILPAFFSSLSGYDQGAVSPVVYCPRHCRRCPLPLHSPTWAMRRRSIRAVTWRRDPTANDKVPLSPPAATAATAVPPLFVSLVFAPTPPPHLSSSSDRLPPCCMPLLLLRLVTAFRADVGAAPHCSFGVSSAATSASAAAARRGCPPPHWPTAEEAAADSRRR
jgi:hypothetical protein